MEIYRERAMGVYGDVLSAGSYLIGEAFALAPDLLIAFLLMALMSTQGVRNVFRATER
jgi:hypothetical protein